MKNVLCLKCEWEGDYEEAISFTEEELEALKEMLFRDQLLLGKPGYKMFTHLYGYICPKCESVYVLDLCKLKQQAITSNRTFIQTMNEIKNSLNRISHAKS